MKFPYIRISDNTPVSINITEGISEFGEPIVVATYNGNCNYHEKSRTVRNADGTYVYVNGSLTVGCDIAPNVKVLAGNVGINGKKWDIYSAVRLRNPDGTIYATKLELVK